MGSISHGLLVVWAAVAMAGHNNPVTAKQHRDRPRDNTTTVGTNSLMCITFDKPLHKEDGFSNKMKRPKDTDVNVQSNCGLQGNCGVFRRPFKIKMPLCKKNELLDISVSVWFKRQRGPGYWPVFASGSNCKKGTIQIISLDDTHLVVLGRHCAGQLYLKMFNTGSQTREWRHVAVTMHIGKVGKRNWIEVYIDGNMCQQSRPIFGGGRLGQLLFRNFFGVDVCGRPVSRRYSGLVDSISVANYVLTQHDVQVLFQNRGLCIGLNDNFKEEKGCGKNWALIVAGSKGYHNYRHQADACHAYRVVRNRGIPEDRIVLMMYDDIANNTLNPDKGQLFNRLNGPNVYDVNIDYKGDDVTAHNFLNVLRGNQAAMNGIGSGKVINSGPDDNVFVYYTNHGGPGVLGFPYGQTLTATSLKNAIYQMYNGYQYNQMVFYIDACYSGSMFNGILPTGINVYATTASGPTETSFAHYYSTHHAVYLGDEYSVFWTEDSDVKDLEMETLKEQYLIVKAKTQHSTVHEYGQLSVADNSVADFQAWPSCCEDNNCCRCSGELLTQPKRPLTFSVTPQHETHESVTAEDVPLAILRHKLAATTDNGSRAEIVAQIRKIKQTREAVVEVFRKIVKLADVDDNQTLHILTARHEISNFDCYEAAMQQFNEKCFSVSQNQFAMLQLQVLVNICEEGIPKSTLLQIITSVCSPSMDRRKFYNIAD